MQMNKPSPRLAILRAQLAAKAEPWHNMSADAFEHGVHMPSDPPLPPDYWSELERWTKTLAPAKPAVPQPEPTPDVWHSEAPSAAGCYIASAFNDETRARWFDGLKWHQDVGLYASTAEVRASVVESASYQSRIKWLRLIEADATLARLADASSAMHGFTPISAEQPAAELKHSVCIKAHHGVSGLHWSVGRVAKFPPANAAAPECFRACDADGWIPHTPTPNAVCPVPSGVEYESKLRNGKVSELFSYFGPHSNDGYDIVAWRPVPAKDAS